MLAVVVIHGEKQQDRLKKNWLWMRLEQGARLHLRGLSRRRILNKNTEQFSDVPYVSCDDLAQQPALCMFQEKVTYVMISRIWKENGKILGLLTLVVAVFAVVALVFVFALDENNRKLFCGLAATIFSIVMYASPLTIIVSSSPLSVLMTPPTILLE
ncbi:hypothetical protein Leryth_004521 [Lithospermum erythrorhizon]|nr:hypothetical protein Leryth_004521 [Lithospermum erythrorhizon]